MIHEKDLCNTNKKVCVSCNILMKKKHKNLSKYYMHQMYYLFTMCLPYDNDLYISILFYQIYLSFLNLHKNLLACNSSSSLFVSLPLIVWYTYDHGVTTAARNRRSSICFFFYKVISANE